MKYTINFNKIYRKNKKKRKDPQQLFKYITFQLIYLYVKYDETFATLLLGYFRHIPHLETKYQSNSNYHDEFKELIDVYITSRRVKYSKFNDIMKHSQTQEDIANIPSILSKEHINNSDEEYDCMGDLYESESELMNMLLICEYFDKNYHIYGDDQNYVIKRQLRDNIIPNKKSGNIKYSNKIIGFTLREGSSTSARVTRLKKKYITKDIYYSWRVSNKTWKIIVSNIPKTYKYKEFFYIDNTLIGISSTIESNIIKIKLLDKKISSKTLTGKSNRKEANTGIICANGPSRIQKNRLIKDIELLLDTTLDYYEYIEQFKSKFSDDIIPVILQNVGNKLKIYIDGIESSYDTPENPIVHYIYKSKNTSKAYKKITIKDFCLIVSVLLRYKEYEHMFYDSIDFDKKWFYNNEESNNKYIEIFNK